MTYEIHYGQRIARAMLNSKPSQLLMPKTLLRIGNLFPRAEINQSSVEAENFFLFA